MGDQLTVSVSSVDGCAMVALAGESSVSTVSQWRDVLAGLVEAGPDRVVVDLSGLRSVAAAGAHVLVEAQEALMARGGSLAVACPDGAVTRVLGMTGADQRIPVYGSVREAVRGNVPLEA